MWIGDFFIGRTLNICGFKVYCGSKVSWIGFIYFTILLTLTSIGIYYRQTENQQMKIDINDDPYLIWMICVVILRACDIGYSFYTGIRRHIDPRKRYKFLVMSMKCRTISFIGGLPLTIYSIIMIAQNTIPKNPLFEAIFYANFIPLIIIYGILVFVACTPCGWCMCCMWFLYRENDGNRDQNNNLSQDWSVFLDSFSSSSQRRERRQNNQPNNQSNNQSNNQPYNQPNEEENEYDRIVPRINFNALMGTDDLDCAICVEEFGPTDILRKLPCDHYFHQSCIDKWQAGTCPLCRHEYISQEAYNRGRQNGVLNV